MPKMPRQAGTPNPLGKNAGTLLLGHRDGFFTHRRAPPNDADRAT